MKEFRVEKRLMGSAFELIVIGSDEKSAALHLEAGIGEISRIENLLTEFAGDSDTSLINMNAGISPVLVNDETFQLIRRCMGLSALTQGAFDITVSPLKKLYNFKNGKSDFPDSETLQKTLQEVGFQYIQLLKNNQVSLSGKRSRISFSAIGKGYAADCVKKLWRDSGVQHGVINASGDLTVLGERIDGQPWKIGIADPDKPERLLCYLPVRNCSVATSGNYEQYFVKSGIRYGHTINPKTGMPVAGIKSVTVVGPGAELCDALATAVYVMGIETGLHFINQLPNTHCLIIDDRNKIFKSVNLNFFDAES